MKKLTLSIISADSISRGIQCDNIVIPVEGSGSFGSGKYGIRAGHSEAVFSLEKGELIASENGERVYTESLFGGIAYVKNNVVKIIK